jgi:hypothetical protein
MVFMHAVLAQIGLPRSRVEGRRFERTSGGASLLVEAGEIWDGRKWVQQHVPYGPKPRVMMADLFTTAMRNQSRVIDLGESVTEYLRHLGWTKQGGPKGPLTLFKNQARALAVCRMTLGVSYGDRAHQISGQPIEGFDSWLDDQGKQRTLWPARVYLSEQFWKSLQTHAVPLDMRAVMALKSSALALDLYTWLAYRLHRLKKPLVLPWQLLKGQFGQEYKDDYDFKREVLRVLSPVLQVYPGAKLAEVQEGLELHPSRPPVLPRKARAARALPSQKS